MIKVALIGNPNCGKTTLFNALTGATAHVGNWPGVTIEKKEGVYKKSKEPLEIVDLPGIYSLSPYTPEEVVSRNFLIDEKPDVVINIIDATNLERNLYLTTQVLEVDIPVVVALNMMDILEKENATIDIALLEKELGAPVVCVSALKGTGLKELADKVCEVSKTSREGKSILSFSSLKSLYQQVKEMVEKEIDMRHPIFHTVKLIEMDEIEKTTHPTLSEKVKALEQKEPLDEFEGDFGGKVADARYQYISLHFSNAIKKKEENQTLTKSDKIDKVLTHRIWGIPIFLAIMFLVFHLTFSENLFFIGAFIKEGTFDIPIIGTDAINSPGVMLQSCMEWLTSTIGDALSGWLESAPAWVSSLIVDGIWEGLSAVLSFIPQILCLFFFICILEDSGYMARVAFIMDRAFRRFGLSGKAFMPLLMCFGCAVPGIMATRTLENEKERRMTVMLTPFFSCGAKLPVWGVFAAILFAGRHGDLVVFSMYLLGIVVAIITAVILKLTALKGDPAPFIMELPAYHLPQAKNVAIHLWEKLKYYIYRAATVITGAIIVIWFLSTFSFTFKMVEDAGDSILGVISKGITWLFVPLGFGMGKDGWKFVVAAFTGLIAKEMVPATLGTFAGMDGDLVLEADNETLRGSALAALIGTLSVPAAFAFMAFNLLSVPCMAAVAAARGELQSKKKFWFTIAFWMITAYVVSLIIYWVGTYWWIGIILLAIILCAVTILIVMKKQKKMNVTFNH